MAHQMHIIYSETIKGAGLIVGGAYYSKCFGCNSMPRSPDTLNGEE